MAIKIVRRSKNVLLCGRSGAVVALLAPLLCALRAVAAPPRFCLLTAGGLLAARAGFQAASALKTAAYAV